MTSKERFEFQLERLKKLYLRDAPWVLRITERKDRPCPYLEIKTRQWQIPQPLRESGIKTQAAVQDNELSLQPVLKECGCFYGAKATRCIDALKKIITGIRTPDDNLPMELERVVKGQQFIVKKQTLPLNDDAGVKLALLFKVQEGLKDLDRTELAAWRVARFTREEALYWYSRATTFSRALNNWSLSGMRVMLAGGSKAKKEDVKKLLEELRYE